MPDIISSYTARHLLRLQANEGMVAQRANAALPWHYRLGASEIPEATVVNLVSAKLVEGRLAANWLRIDYALSERGATARAQWRQEEQRRKEAKEAALARHRP